MKPVKTIIVGCGNIAATYAEQISGYPEIELAGFFDLDQERADGFSAKYGGKTYPRLDEVIADDSIELVVNLTIHHAHCEVITRCLQAGKHVHSEKPLAMSSREANDLVTLANRNGLRLSSAPSTFLGEAAQTLGREIRSGKTGTLRLLYAEINHGRIETWHPNPAPFYEVGPVWDVAVYPLGIWAATCGPIERVTAFGKVLLSDRIKLDGTPFTISTPDSFFAVVEFANGVVGRLTTNFYVKPSKQGASMEFHGDTGSLYLESSHKFNGGVEFAPFGGEFSKVPLVRPGFEGVEFARGVQELVRAIREERPHRCAAEMAAHVVEVIEAIHTSARTEKPVGVESRFSLPPPMPWAG